jgi:hypothetical protein
MPCLGGLVSNDHTTEIPFEKMSGYVDAQVLGLDMVRFSGFNQQNEPRDVQ